MRCVNALKQASFISTQKNKDTFNIFYCVNALKQASFISTVMGKYFYYDEYECQCPKAGFFHFYGDMNELCTYW